MLTVGIVGSVDRQLDELLTAAGRQLRLLPAAGLAGLAQPSAHPPDVLVLDLRDGSGIPSPLAAVKRQHPATGVLIVAPALDPALLLDAMRAGVNEFVTDPLTAETLTRALNRVIGQRGPAVLGRVIGFVGAKGGVGTTTVAVNVATALGAIGGPGRTLLLDLHQTAGDAAVFLGAEPRFSVVDALENTHRLDPTFFQSLVARVAPGLDLLPSSERTVAGPLEAGKVRATLDFVATMYRFAVLDLPRSDPAVLDALECVSPIVIVANQELAAVRNASRMAAALRQRYGHERVTVIVSRVDRQADIAQAEVERAVGGSIVQTIPSDYRTALHALHRGRPLVLDNHNELSAAFRTFAQRLAGVEPERSPERSTGLLGLFGPPRRH